MSAPLQLPASSARKSPQAMGRAQDGLGEDVSMVKAAA